MNLNHIFNQIDKSPQNKHDVDVIELGFEFGLDLPYVHDPARISSYWVGRWMCTDTLVGYRVYFLDDQPMAFSIQRGRKSKEYFYWASKAIAESCRDYLKTFIEDIEVEIEVFDMEQEFEEGFSIHFNEQIIDTDRVSYNGEPVRIIEQHRENGSISKLVKIQPDNAPASDVEVSDLFFGFHLSNS